MIAFLSARGASPAARTTPARTARTVRRAALAAATAVVASLAGPAAHALPVNATCRVTTYYAEAGMTTVVGKHSTCPGSQGMTGRRTAFFDVDEIQIGNGPRPKPPTRPGFPCDLQEHCVNSLPTPMVVTPWPQKRN